MLVNFEPRHYNGKEQVWIGRYRSLHNLPHWHLESELIYVEKGNVIVSDDRKIYHLSAGDSIFLAGGDIHYIQSEPDSVLSLSLFNSALIKDLLDNYRPAEAKLCGKYPIPDTFRALSMELKNQDLFYESKLCELITGLMIDIFRGEPLIPYTPAARRSSIQAYKNLLDKIHIEYEYITFSDAAAFMGLSEPYFSKFFRKISGMTFSRYLNIVKLEHAIELLKHNPTHMSITEIAAKCGFDTIRHFNRVFKDICGMSPRQLPPDYILDVSPIRNIQDAFEFDPTLQNSELLP